MEVKASVYESVQLVMGGSDLTKEPTKKFEACLIRARAKDKSMTIDEAKLEVDKAMKIYIFRQAGRKISLP